MTWIQAMDIGIKENKPVLFFLGDSETMEYGRLKKMLEQKNVKELINNFVYIEYDVLKNSYFNQLLYACPRNLFIIIEEDSIVSTFSNILSSNILIDKLKKYRNNPFSETIKRCSLLDTNSQMQSVVINQILRAQYLYQKDLITVEEYKSRLNSTVDISPYFYNKYLVAIENGSFIDNDDWIDSLTFFEQRLYSELVKELIHKRYHIDPTEKADVYFDKSKFIFENIKSNDCLQHVFQFINRGKTPLIIYNVESSCGCIATTWPRKPIPFNNSDSIIVCIKGIESGFFRKRIKVTSNSNEGIVILEMSGEVK